MCWIFAIPSPDMAPCYVFCDFVTSYFHSADVRDNSSKPPSDTPREQQFVLTRYEDTQVDNGPALEPLWEDKSLPDLEANS